MKSYCSYLLTGSKVKFLHGWVPNAVILYYNLTTDVKQFQNFINQKLYKQPDGFCTQLYKSTFQNKDTTQRAMCCMSAIIPDFIYHFLKLKTQQNITEA